MKKTILMFGVPLMAVMLSSAGTWAHDDNHHDTVKKHHDMKSDCSPAQFTAAQTDLVSKTMKESYEHDKLLYKESHRLHWQLGDILAADKFDKDAFIKLSKELETVRDKISKNNAQALATIAGQFSPNERVALFRLFDEHHEGAWHEGTWHHHEWYSDHETTASTLYPDSVGVVQPDQVQPNSDYPPYSKK